MLYVHIDFTGKNKKVVCTKINMTFFKNLQLFQNSKMVDLDIMQSLKMAEYFARFWVMFYTQRSKQWL